MKISDIHERLRTVLLRRVERGELTVGLLSQQTGLVKSHLSKYLHAKGRLSRDAMDCILRAQDLEAEDLVGSGMRIRRSERMQLVPVVSPTSELFEPEIRVSTVKMWLPMPLGALRPLEERRVPSRHSWRRFVAMSIDDDEAEKMGRLAYKGAIAIIDRHYNSMRSCHQSRQNLYAVRDGRRVVVRYVDAIAGHLVIRPINSELSADWIEDAAKRGVGEYIAGRVAMILNMV